MEKLSVKALRINNNLTCDDMAKALGISKQAYSYKENGRRAFTANELIAICEKFEISDVRKLKL